MFTLQGRVAAVVGASSGLGAQLARVLAKQGASIALLARRKDKLEALAKELQGTGATALPFSCDIANTTSINDAAQAVIDRFKKVDILVNCAGIAVGGKSEDLSNHDWQTVVDINLTGLFYCCRRFGKEMIANKYGRIINIASMYGQVANTFSPNASYHATKGAVINLTRALAVEWAQHGITVNAIGPGFFLSEMTQEFLDTPNFSEFISHACPMKRPGKPGELDTALLYLASEHTSYTTGTTLFVDGGWTAI